MRDAAALRGCRFCSCLFPYTESAVGSDFNLQRLEVLEIDSGAQNFPGPDIESGVVPNARDDMAIKPALVERIGEMAAGIVERVDFSFDLGQQNLLVADLRGRQTALGNLRSFDSSRRRLFPQDALD